MSGLPCFGEKVVIDAAAIKEFNNANPPSMLSSAFFVVQNPKESSDTIPSHTGNGASDRCPNGVSEDNI